MAILNKITPALILENKANIELLLSYDTAETPWTKADICFYNLEGTEITGSTISNLNVIDAKIVANNVAIGTTLIANTKYLVSVVKHGTDIKTNSRVLLIMTAPTLSEDITIERENKKVWFTYTPTYSYEPLDTYQFSITDTTDNVICETSALIKNTKAAGEHLEYYYSSYLEPGHSYSFKVTTYSKSGLMVEKTATIDIPANVSYENSPALIPIKPQIFNDEEYGCVRISMPTEVIRYCSDVRIVSGDYSLFIPHCYGCDSSKDRIIYPSLSLQNGVKLGADTNVTLGTGTWRLRIPSNRIQLTETCCVGFAPKGKFKLVKESHLGEIEELTTIALPEDKDYVYEDYMVDQGYEYKYYLLPDYDGLTSGALAAEARPHWNSILLSDAQGKLLSIQYNPQISSFKTTVLEQKQETLGNKFPFFLRNGDTYYKEIPLSGLISYQADTLNKFQIPVLQDYINNLNANVRRGSNPQALKDYDEFYLERIYKTEVEKWLNNGEPKLLRTAAEGTFIVRLMNVSLSPMQQLGRRIHTFSATAYEIDDYNNTNLEKYGFKNLNTAPSTSVSSDVTTFTGVATIEEKKLVIRNIPAGEGENIYKIVINKNLDNKITKVCFKNTAEAGGADILYISDILSGQIEPLSPGNSVTRDITGNTLWFYVWGTDSSNAEVELLYNSVVLSQGGSE